MESRRFHLLFGALAFWGVVCLCASPAYANTYSDTCAGCHANTSTSPPFMPSQDSSSGLIMSEEGQFTDPCLTNNNCVLRQKMSGTDSMGNIVNPTARTNMLSYAQSFSNSELEAVRLYLLQVRDDSVSGPSSSAYGFPDTATGSNSSLTRSFTVSNYRGAAVGYSFAVTGTNASDFSITSSSNGSCAATSSSGTPTSCGPSVTIKFTPGSGGARSATLNLAFSATSGDPVPYTRTFSLSGNGVVPTPGFSISTTSETFTAELGSGATQSLTISNPSGATANLILGTISYGASQYTRAAATSCSNGLSIAPGSNCTLATTFTPTAAGTLNSSITVTHNAAGNPATVTLAGTGTQSLISPTSSTLAFDNVQLGVPKVLNQTVTNSGTATLVFSAEPSSGLSGAGSGDYAVGGTCHVASPLPPGASCNLAVTFTPSVLGARPASLAVTSDATNGALTVSLTGASVALPEPVLTFPSSDFPDTVIGQLQAITRTVTIENNRTRDISYSVANITDFNVIDHSCPTHVVTGGGGTCTVTVQFAPTLGSGEGRRQGTLSFTFTGTGGDAAPSSASGAVAGTALLPLTLSSTSLNAAAVVGAPTTSSIVLTNRSASSITLSSLAISGATASDYSIDPTSGCTSGLVLAASANCTLVVRFAPATAGTRNATLTVTHTAIGSPQTVQLLGTATAAPQGRIALSATSLTFADAELASTTPLSVTVANTGNLALDFSAFTISGTAAAEFSSGGSCVVGTPVPSGGQCTLTVSFTPAVLGARSAALAIVSDASNGTATLALSGSGVPVPTPQVMLTPTTLDFGSQTNGGLYPSRRIHLANTGTANLTIGSIVVAGTGFSDVSSAACPSVLAAGAGCDVDIALAATSAIAYSGTLTVTDNAAGSPHIAALRGTGVAGALPALVWSPAATSLDFGQVAAGTVSASQSLTLSNQGPGGVTLTVLNAVGADGASFSVVGGTCNLTAPLFDGRSCTVDVVFAPGSSGAKTATIQVASTGSFPPTVTLTGTGLAGPNPSLDVSVASLSFETTPVGAQSLPQDVRLTSSGSGVVTISALATDGPYAIQSTTCPGLPFTLAAGSQCTVSVLFRPTSAGSIGGTLRVTSDAAPADRDVALTGGGEENPSLSSGGCTLGDGRRGADPLLWLTTLLAAAALVGRAVRRRRDATSLRRDASEEEPL